MISKPLLSSKAFWAKFGVTGHLPSSQILIVKPLQSIRPWNFFCNNHARDLLMKGVYILIFGKDLEIFCSFLASHPPLHRWEWNLALKSRPLVKIFFDWPITTDCHWWLFILYYYFYTRFNGLFSRTAWVSQYQKGNTSLNLNEAWDDGVFGCSGISWTICKQSAPHSW